MRFEKFRDRKLIHSKFLFESVLEENSAQLDKWGVQYATLPEWNLWLSEEVGEVGKAIAEMIYREGPAEDVYNEAIQVATLALKIAEISGGAFKSD